MNCFKINDFFLGKGETYFIADIGANHDGSFERAKELILLAKQSGAHAVKFQHFSAKNFISDAGFRKLQIKKSHQSSWKKSVYEIYEDASIPLKWTTKLKSYCDDVDITFLSSPYGLEMVEHLSLFVPAWKIGSGDINYHEQLVAVAKTKKPIIIATGASKIEEVISCVEILQSYGSKIVLMQCNTNYTGKDENYDHINLKVLETYKALFPDIMLGLSDHTFGSETVLGAISLGAKVIEKHFTDDNSRIGPDHPFSMNPETWSSMVRSAKILERSLGTPIKMVCPNERDTAILQRRSLVCNIDLDPGTKLESKFFSARRPCIPGSVDINRCIDDLILKSPLKAGSPLMKEDV